MKKGLLLIIILSLLALSIPIVLANKGGIPNNSHGVGNPHPVPNCPNTTIENITMIENKTIIQNTTIIQEKEVIKRETIIIREERLPIGLLIGLVFIGAGASIIYTALTKPHVLHKTICFTEKVEGDIHHYETTEVFD